MLENLLERPAHDSSTELETAPCVEPEPCLSTLGLVELLLKDPARVDELGQRPECQRDVFTRLLLIAQLSYAIYGVMMGLVLNVSSATSALQFHSLPVPPASWHDGSVLGLPMAYNLGIVLAACVCLPSFYFYSLLAGAPLTWLQISLVVAKGTAANAVMLLGILPIYVAVVLGGIVFQAPADVMRWELLAGLLLPFVAGLWGLLETYRGIVAMSARLPPLRLRRRLCFLSRLTLSWTTVYMMVVPVMIYRLWQHFAAWFGMV
jgi:hypothetical protein